MIDPYSQVRQVFAFASASLRPVEQVPAERLFALRLVWGTRRQRATVSIQNRSSSGLHGRRPLRSQQPDRDGGPWGPRGHRRLRAVPSSGSPACYGVGFRPPPPPEVWAGAAGRPHVNRGAGRRRQGPGSEWPDGGARALGSWPRFAVTAAVARA